MRVGVIGHAGRDKFAGNISDTLRRMGHQVICFGPPHSFHRHRLMQRAAGLVRGALPTVDECLQRRIVRSGLDAGLDVVINIDLRLLPATVAGLKSGGAKAAFWFPDAVSQLGRQSMVLSPYDAVFFKEPHIVRLMRDSLDLPAYYLPQACNPRWHRPAVPAGTDRFLVIAGNMYPVRVRLLERLLAKGIPVKLYGPPIPPWTGHTPLRAVHAGRSVFCEEKAAVFRSAAGVLNTMHPAEVSGVNVRLFEAAGCGAAVITEYRSTVPDLFSPGTEVLTFRDFDELVHQARRLLAQSLLTAELGDAAARRAHRDHTYESRLTTILETLA